MNFAFRAVFSALFIWLVLWMATYIDFRPYYEWSQHLRRAGLLGVCLVMFVWTFHLFATVGKLEHRIDVISRHEDIHYVWFFVAEALIAIVSAMWIVAFFNQGGWLATLWVSLGLYAASENLISRNFRFIQGSPVR